MSCLFSFPSSYLSNSSVSITQTLAQIKSQDKSWHICHQYSFKILWNAVSKVGCTSIFDPTKCIFIDYNFPLQFLWCISRMRCCNIYIHGLYVDWNIPCISYSSKCSNGHLWNFIWWYTPSEDSKCDTLSTVWYCQWCMFKMQ